MANDSPVRKDKPKLTVTRNDKNEDTKANLFKLKKVENKQKVLMPPEGEGYIKAKRHDFF